jgi:hypothetical protein
LAGGVAPVVECLSRKHEVLNSKPSITGKEKVGKYSVLEKLKLVSTPDHPTVRKIMWCFFFLG